MQMALNTFFESEQSSSSSSAQDTGSSKGRLVCNSITYGCHKNFGSLRSHAPEVERAYPYAISGVRGATIQNVSQKR
jgi:hypothetical protein